MKVTISKSIVEGDVTVPSSKSLTIRALFCAALSAGESEISNPLICDDTSYAADVLAKIGATTVDIDGVWHVNGGKFKIPEEELYCGESATTLRFMTAVVSLLPGTIMLTCGPGLMKRPIRGLVDALAGLGVRGSTAGAMTPPVVIQGGTLRGGITEIPGNVSSQYISALLLIAPVAPSDVVISLTTPLTSRPYVLMTLWCLKKFGITVNNQGNSFIVKRQRYVPTRINIEGDWSSASYLLALGALSEEGIRVENLNTSSLQGDRIILDHLRNMGAVVRVSGNTVSVQKGNLKAVRVDLTDSIDLLPTMAVLAALAKGVSELRGIQRARIKESNRVTAMREGLTRLGVQFSEFKDYITIRGMDTQKKPEEDGSQETMLETPEDYYPEEKEKEPVVVDSYNDHRVAMAFAVFGAAVGGVIIKDAECVTKTFPGFWEAFKKVGGRIDIDE